MFSSRLHSDLQPNPLTQLAEAKRREGAAVLDLTESNPTRAGLGYPEQAILEALAQPRALVYEPAPFGLPLAREVVAEYYGERGHQVVRDRVLLTASTSEAYSYLFKLLSEPGDEVLVPRPSYPLFEYLAALDSVRAIPYSLAYHGRWFVDMDSLQRALTPRTRAVLIVNPNNPTGSFLKREELGNLMTLCAANTLAILSDEVFLDYALEPDADRFGSLAGIDQVLTFCLSGLSKIAGLPQLKLAWMTIGGPPELLNGARGRLELIADTYLSVGAPVQHALPQLMALSAAVREQIQQRTRANRTFLQHAIGSASPCTLLHVEGGWYAVLQLPQTRGEEQWCLDLLRADNVLVQPGYFYDFEQLTCVVLSLLTPPQAFEEGVQRLLARVKSS
jgi:alanine-synthesizing transaminase